MTISGGSNLEKCVVVILSVWRGVKQDSGVSGSEVLRRFGGLSRALGEEKLRRRLREIVCDT